MADTYTLETVLKARDGGFQAGMQAALKTTESLGTRLKSGIGFGAFMAIGTQAVNAVTGSIGGLIGEMSASQAAWKTFEGNMKNFGKADQIPKIKKELQEYAQETIYSSSDMASAYAQFASVGIKSANKLVTGFGGLASAADNPTQAMKTLSQQGIQMAAKPMVAWQDFKLMLEQTPAGISAVAKSMGMTTKQLIENVQDGTVKTEDFFKAVEKVGNSDAWSKQARTYKTAGQALDGLRETAANKLMPVYNAVTDVIIRKTEKVTDALGKLDVEKLIKSKRFKTAMQIISDGLSGIGRVAASFGRAFVAIGGSIADMAGQAKGAKPAFDVLVNALVKVGDFAAEHSKAIARLAVAFGAFKVVRTFAPFVSTFAGSLVKMASAGLGGLAGKLFGTAQGTKAMGTASAQSATQMWTAAKSFTALGAGVLMIAAGFWIMANAATSVAEAGPAAIAVLVGMVGAIAGLAYGASVIGTALTAAAPGMLAFGGAVALTGLGLMAAGKAAQWFAQAIISVMPSVISLIRQMTATAVQIITTFGSQIVAIVQTAGNVILNIIRGISTGVSTILSGVAKVVTAIGNGISKVLGGVARIFDSIGNAAKNAGAGVKLMADGVRSIAGIKVGTLAKSLGAVAIGLGKIKSASTGLGSVGAALRSTGASAQAAASAMKSGMSKATSAAASGVKTVIARLRSGAGSARSAGAHISSGFAAGMRSGLGEIEAAANRMVAAADRAIRAKAKIHSPSRLTKGLGAFVGKGFADGIISTYREIRTAASGMISMPNVAVPAFVGSYDGSLSSEYNYNGGEYTIIVPVEIDGKETARVTAPYTEAELNKRQARANRKKGVR
ncbi:tape measure protein [Hornefia butyriciproducens]|uniref:tape measure protein n=1 Tax=Hornefia butyriciproducens TaxID=2652293 RepID=UPI002A90FCBE|nr:tape measure protein [Hornefia butyriciproducens]MCI7413037.1 tape measure protein [Clostridiales bacterium]MDY6212418.1 tape measure protein [Hornefia butyriciproducens]